MDAAAAHLNEALARAEDLRSRCATLAVELARATASRDEAARALAREEAAHADALRRVAAATEALASLSAAHLASRSPELAAALEDAQRQRDVLLELRKASLDEVRALKAPPRPLVRLFQMVRLSFERTCVPQRARSQRRGRHTPTRPSRRTCPQIKRRSTRCWRSRRSPTSAAWAPRARPNGPRGSVPSNECTPGGKSDAPVRPKVKTMLKRGDLLAVLHAYPAAGLAHHPLCDHALGAAVAKWIGDKCVSADGDDGAPAKARDASRLPVVVDSGGWTVGADGRSVVRKSCKGIFDEGPLRLADVRRANKACAALHGWIASQLALSTICATHRAVLLEEEAWMAKLAAAEACLRTAASDEAAAERRVDDSRADVDDAEAYAEAIGQAVAEAERARDSAEADLADAEQPAVEVEEEEAIPEATCEVTALDVTIKETVVFLDGAAAIPVAALPAVRAVARAMKADGRLKVSVDGHASKAEDPAVADARVAAVAAKLEELGVDPARLRHEGHGAATAARREVQFTVIQELRVSDTVQFSACSSDVTDGSAGVLDAVARVLAERPHLVVRVEGHCCTSPMWGSTTIEELAADRAEAVVAALAAWGVPRDQLRPRGFGADLPVDVANKRLNRRTEFHVVDTDVEKNLRRRVREPAARRRTAEDPAALARLRGLAAQPAGLPMRVRWAAARLLLAARADWRAERVLWLLLAPGAKRPPLNPDVIRSIGSWCYVLGAFDARTSAKAPSKASSKPPARRRSAR